MSSRGLLHTAIYPWQNPRKPFCVSGPFLREVPPCTEAERALGPKFNRQKYHDFILAQGLLPPALLRKAVLEEFVPSQAQVAQGR